MLKSFFFVPADHPKLLEKLAEIKADFLIIDLEDSVDPTVLDDTFDRLKELNIHQELFVRPRFTIESEFTYEYFQACLELGFSRFIIPKYETLGQLEHLERIIASFPQRNWEFVLLIENPSALVSLEVVLQKTKLNILGLGFGSHDYSMSAGLQYKAELLNFPRFKITTLAKAYKLLSVDIACMEIQSSEVFLKELESGFDFGFDAKFIIHPRQLELMKQYRYYGEEEVTYAKDVLQTYQDQGSPNIFTHKGKTIELPHLAYYKKIINWNHTYES